MSKRLTPTPQMIDAAPDLLEALQLVAGTWGNVDTLTEHEFQAFLYQCADEEEQNMWRKVRRAIHKANQTAPAEHKGFWVKTPDGNTMHVHGDPNMSEETLTALQHMMELAVKQYAPARADTAQGETQR